MSDYTDDDREALIDVMVMTKLSDYATTDMSAIHQAVDAILAAGFRRPAQIEPTDAMVIAALNAWHQDVMPVNRLGVFGTQKEDLMRAALLAAFTAGQEEQS